MLIHFHIIPGMLSAFLFSSKEEESNNALPGKVCRFTVILIDPYAVI